ncbi:MAG: formyltransferase family protein [bacterium]
MQTLPITILFHEGPIARAYLSSLYHSGYKADEIISLIYTKQPSTKKKIGWWLPKPIRIAYLKKVQELSFNYWPKQIKKEQPIVFKAIIDNLKQVYPMAEAIIGQIIDPKPIKIFSNNVKYVLADNINDRNVERSLEAARNDLILFTGGGILKKNILGIRNKRYLHVHPGYLPDIKGADGLLWSTLIRKKPGASAFFMAEKIDTGNIIDRQEFKSPNFKIPKGSRPNNKTLYRAIFSYYDPLIRAELLLGLIKKFKLDDLPEMKQPSNKGDNYSFMDEPTLERAFELLFPNC